MSEEGVSFKIGEFAKICGVKKATLIHYAKIGVLKPDHIGENGYFYYAPEQIYTFEAINLLRGMDISLSEIGVFMKDQNMNVCRGILERSLQKLREKQLYLQRLNNIVEQTINEIDASKQLVMDVVEKVHFDKPTQYIVYEMPYRTSKCAGDLKDARTIIKHCHDSFINSSTSVTGIVLEKDVQNGTFAKSYGAFKAKDDAAVSPDDVLVTRPAGDFLALCSTTNGSDIAAIYQRIVQYARENGYALVGNGYEEDQLSHIVIHDRNHYPIRCYLQIDTQK